MFFGFLTPEHLLTSKTTSAETTSAETIPSVSVKWQRTLDLIRLIRKEGC
ncbi:MAG: hypothetical protein AVDCRST_MAG93-3215 [uncultured Chloroflexia bacterium]|uniref:Uncharacterized protein n=1 Tax=uncultured Chloroflexia bacterium TaxID=1672391 RepID=A0A6J4JL74_9CHLR|nr:MAG: hypothetical protein AVDCRST_MAG93-3215 [uncultured Chloroflexia bacterium]